jgi:magnesium-transporting ATPase (P-type)
MRSIQQAQGALKELAKLLPDTAVRIVGDRMEEVLVSELRDGDLVLIRPGAGIPVDGVVLEGESAINESMITGESRRVRKAEGYRWYGEWGGFAPRRSNRHGRTDCSRGNYAPGRTGSNIAFPSSDFGGHRRVRPHLGCVGVRDRNHLCVARVTSHTRIRC